MEYGILSIAIPLLTIALAIITKDVIVSPMGGIFVGFLVLNAFDPFDAFIALFDGVIALFSEGWIAETIFFILMVGSIIRLLTLSGAVDSFVAYLSQKSKKIDSPRVR
jgi:Na+/H+ antiporter NhaC